MLMIFLGKSEEFCMVSNYCTVIGAYKNVQVLVAIDTGAGTVPQAPTTVDEDLHWAFEAPMRPGIPDYVCVIQAPIHLAVG